MNCHKFSNNQWSLSNNSNDCSDSISSVDSSDISESIESSEQWIDKKKAKEQ